jgi:hypothetical protein
MLGPAPPSFQSAHKSKACNQDGKPLQPTNQTLWHFLNPSAEMVRFNASTVDRTLGIGSIDQSVQSGQFRMRQIIGAAIINGSARKCRAERAELRPALRAPVIPAEWLGPFCRWEEHEP